MYLSNTVVLVFWFIGFFLFAQLSLTFCHAGAVAKQTESWQLLFHRPVAFALGFAFAILASVAFTVFMAGDVGHIHWINGESSMRMEITHRNGQLVNSNDIFVIYKWAPLWTLLWPALGLWIARWAANSSNQSPGDAPSQGLVDLPKSLGTSTIFAPCDPMVLQDWTHRARNLLKAIPAEHHPILGSVIDLLMITPRPASLQTFIKDLPGYRAEHDAQGLYAIVFLDQFRHLATQADNLLRTQKNP